MRIRLAVTAGLALGLVFLTSCRSDPKIAAYVGDTSITEARVTELVNDYNTKAEAASKDTGQSIAQVTNPDAVYVWTARELCARLAKQKGFTYEVEPIPDDAPELIKINADRQACFAAIPEDAGTADDADMRELYDRLVAAGATTAPYEQVLPELEARVRIHNALLSADKLTLNPRYSDVNFVGLPLIAGGVVADAPRPANAQQQ